MWPLAELAAKSGLTGRTIRYYIARGLLPGPLKGGRGAVYGLEHVDRLEQIRRLQARGLTLAEMVQQQALEPAGSKATGSAVEPEAWWQYRVAPDVVVQVRGDASPWRLKQIRTRLAEMAAALQGPGTPEAT